jgi:predicted Rossmann fold nucleotide-binding protein DprA/Smf involved in DNA uptake
LVYPLQITFPIYNQFARINSQKKNASKFQNLSKDELKIVQLLENEGLSFDKIVRNSKLDSLGVASLVLMVEIKGVIQCSDGFFQLTP